MSTSNELISAIVTGAVQDPFPLDDDVRRIYTDHETFSSDYYFDQHQAVYGPVVGEHRRLLDIFLQQFMLTDPAAHTEIRRLLRSAFTPRYLKRWQTVVEEVTESTLQKVDPGTDVDVMAELAPLVPITVIAAMLGVPAGAVRHSELPVSRSPRSLRWTQNLTVDCETVFA